jgi:hypothetical protein
MRREYPEDLKKQTDQLLRREAHGLEATLTPNDLCPTIIRDFPVAIEKSEKLRRACRSHVTELEDRIQLIEDEILSTIENEVIVVSDRTKDNLPAFKKKFSSELKRQRELRLRLAQREDYKELKTERDEWDERVAEWVSHTARLRRELRQLEVDYSANGGGGVGL